MEKEKGRKDASTQRVDFLETAMMFHEQSCFFDAAWVVRVAGRRHARIHTHEAREKSGRTSILDAPCKNSLGKVRFNFSIYRRHSFGASFKNSLKIVKFKRPTFPIETWK